MNKLIDNFIKKEANFDFAGGLLVFYLALSGNFLGDLFSKELRTFFENNRISQHMLGYLTMLMSITYVSGIKSIMFGLILTAILYLWFLLTTKLELKWNIGILLVLLLNLFINKYSNYLKEQKDPSYKKYKTISHGLFTITILTTFIGSSFFLLEKKNKFGDKFNIVDYIFKFDK